jgi:hypothetical protein
MRSSQAATPVRRFLGGEARDVGEPDACFELRNNLSTSWGHERQLMGRVLATRKTAAPFLHLLGRGKR